MLVDKLLMVQLKLLRKPQYTLSFLINQLTNSDNLKPLHKSSNLKTVSNNNLFFI